VVKLLGVIIALIAVGEIPLVHAFAGWIDGTVPGFCPSPLA